MTVNWMLVATITGPILATIFGAWLNRKLENRPKLIVYYGHVSEFDMKPQNNEQRPYKIHTHSIVVRNSGKKPAKNVRIGHAFLPDNYNIFPVINHEIVNLPNGGKELIIPNFVPKRQITISYLYFAPITWSNINTHVESDEGAAKVITVIQTELLPKGFKRIIAWLLIIGLVASIYLLFSGVKWLLF